MSTVTPAAATGTTTTTTSSSTSNTSATSSLLGKDQFLQLMMAELQNQNPMSPNSSDPTQYVTELAQFTSLEQQTNTAQSTAQSAQASQASQALALLGHTVSYVDPVGQQRHRRRPEGRLHDLRADPHRQRRHRHCAVWRQRGLLTDQEQTS